MISVVIPVYNVEKYIEKTLESVIAQDHGDFEVLLVDDGSTDGSCKLIRDFFKDKDIRWQLLQKENGGQSSARNLGLKHAKGERVIFVDSDDVIAPAFLSSLERSLLSKDYDFSFCDFTYVKKQEAPESPNKGTHIYEKEELLEAFLKRTVRFVVPSMMFRTDFLIDNELYFNENTSFSEDQMFIWDVIFHSSRSIYLDQALYGYFLRERSIMTGSAYDRIMRGFREYERFTQKLRKDYPEEEKRICRILPRWELGTLFTAASLLEYEEFKKMYAAMDGGTILRRIKGIGERNAYLLAGVASLSCRLLYILCRKLDLNG